MRKMKRGTFDPRLKLAVVRMVIIYGISIRDVSETMGISANSIHYWITKFTITQNKRSSVCSPITKQQRIRKLELKNKKLRQDVSILKKSSAIFLQK